MVEELPEVLVKEVDFVDKMYYNSIYEHKNIWRLLC